MAKEHHYLQKLDEMSDSHQEAMQQQKVPGLSHRKTCCIFRLGNCLKNVLVNFSEVTNQLIIN